MLFPLRLRILAEVAFKGLFAPRAVYRIGDGGESGDGSVFARVFEEQGQRSMSAHAVTGYADTTSVELGEGLEERVGEL